MTAPLAPELHEAPGGHRLAVRAAGTGPPLLCSAGGPGGYGRLFEVCLAPLTATHRILSWDYRGCGDSSEADEYSVAGDLADLDFLIETLGLEAPVLLGHSYGGMLTQRWAVDHPGRARALVLVNTLRHYGAMVAAVRRSRAGIPEEEYAERMSLLGRCMRGEASPEEVLAYRRRTAPGGLRNQQVLEEMLALQHTDYPVRLAVQRDILAFDVREEIRGLELPVLVTGSPHDQVTGDEPRRIHESIPGSRYVEFDGSAHVPHLEERERFVEVLAGWLAGIPPI